MKCNYCGMELQGDAKFCPKCGTKVAKNLFGTNGGTKSYPECGTKIGGDNTVKDQKSEVDRLKDELREKIENKTNTSQINKADIDISKIKHSGVWLIKLSPSDSAHYHIFQITKPDAGKKITFVKIVKEIGNLGLAEAKQYVEGADSDNPLTIVVDNSYTKCTEYNQVKECCTSGCEYNYVDLGSSSKIVFLDKSISAKNGVAIFKANPSKKSMRVCHDICDHDYIDF